MDGSVSNIRISGLAAAVPRNVVDNFSVDNSGDMRLAKLTGVMSRRICFEDQTFSDLAYEAVSRLINLLGWDKSEISLLIVVTQSPDMVYPGVACGLHGRIGLAKACGAFDINLGCSGYPYALYTLASMLSNSLGKKALLVVGDTAGKPALAGAPLSSNILFGDGASATAIEKDSGAACMHFSLFTDGSRSEAISCRRPGGRPGIGVFEYKHFVDKDGFVHLPHYSLLKGDEVTYFSLSEIPTAINKSLSKLGLNIDDLDGLILHQANLAILNGIIRKIGIGKEKVPISLDCFGNTSSCSVPLTLIQHFMQPRRSRQEKILLCGYGVGLSWSTCIVDIDCHIPVSIVEV